MHLLFLTFKKDKDGNIVAVLLLEDTEETRKIWNYKYVG